MTGLRRWSKRLGDTYTVFMPVMLFWCVDPPTKHQRLVPSQPSHGRLGVLLQWLFVVFIFQVLLQCSLTAASAMARGDDQCLPAAGIMQVYTHMHRTLLTFCCLLSGRLSVRLMSDLLASSKLLVGPGKCGLHKRTYYCDLRVYLGFIHRGWTRQCVVQPRHSAVPAGTHPL
jgi:hypothetical protein